MYLKYGTLDYTLANNGMSSEQWVGYRVIDKNSKVVALFNLDVFPDGKIGAFVRAGNYNSTTSSGVSGYMGVFAHKDGSVSYSISNSDKFREAIDNAAYIDANTIINNQVIIADGTDGKLKSSGYTIESSVPSNAIFTDEKVKTVNGVSSTNRYILFKANSGTDTSTCYTNTGFSYRSVAGTTSTDGYSQLVLGNSINSGTTDNQYGIIRFYPKTGAGGSSYANLMQTSMTNNSSITHILPATGGTIVNRATNTALTSNQVVIASGDSTISSSGFTIESSVPSGAIFTDEKVLQQNSTSGKYRPLLMGYDEINSPNDYSTTSVTNKTFKSQNLLFTPATGTLTTTNGYFKLLNSINTVTYQKTTDSGDTKYPAKWYCSMGKAPVDGDTVTITVPSEGGDNNGVYLSIEGNTNAKYKPISVSKTTKLTTHFAAGEIITLVYRATGSTNAIYPIGGGTETTTVSGGCWSVLNYYNTNTDTKVTDTVGTANTFYPAGKTGTGTGTVTQVFDTALKFTGTTGTTSAVGKAELTLGNATASGTANNKQGSLVIYGSTKYAHTINGAPTAARTLTLPDKGGTIAVTTDITDEKVAQEYTTSGNNYRVLLSYSANDITETKGARKSEYLSFKPSTKTLKIGSNTSGIIQFVNVNESIICELSQTPTIQNAYHYLPSKGGTLLNNANTQYSHNSNQFLQGPPLTLGTITINDVETDVVFDNSNYFQEKSQYPDTINYSVTGDKIKTSGTYYSVDDNGDFLVRIYYGRPSNATGYKENVGVKDIPYDFILAHATSNSSSSPCYITLSLIGDIGTSMYIRKKSYRIYKMNGDERQFNLTPITDSERAITINANGGVTNTAVSNVLVIYGIKIIKRF